MVDDVGRIVLVNREIERLFGYSREELLGRPVEMLVPERLRAGHPSQRKLFVENPRVRAMAAGSRLHGRRKDGVEIPLEIGLTPLVTDEGMFILSTVVDLSPRLAAEERFRLAVESAPSGMLMIDGAGKMVLVNQEIERMFGWSREQLLGRQIEMLVPERFRARHPAERARFFEAPSRRSMGVGRELFGLRSDGQEFPVEIGLNPIEAPGGTLVLASIVDISIRMAAEHERKRLEDQFRQAQKMEAIGQLAGGIAHDFNNLLMGIIGCGELAQRSLPDGHHARELLREMCGAAERGATLTRDLLDYSRKRPQSSTPTEVNAVVRVAERMLRQIIGEDIRVGVSLSDDPTYVQANPTHLEHVLLNLAVNARDAMPRGGQLTISTSRARLPDPLETRVRTLEPGEYVVLQVDDTGSGMDEDTLRRIFEPFFTTKPVGEGTGLGLHTVFTLVDHLRGGIEVESRLGHGSVFRVFLPALRTDPPAQHESARSARRVSGRHTATILVLEDERLIRATLKQLLTNLGHHVLAAESVAQALELSRRHGGPIELLLSDMVLSDGSGSEVAARLRQVRPEVRVLFMSAYPADMLRSQGRLGPHDRALEKPFDSIALEVAVSEVLESGVGAPILRGESDD